MDSGFLQDIQESMCGIQVFEISTIILKCGMRILQDFQNFQESLNFENFKNCRTGILQDFQYMKEH